MIESPLEIFKRNRAQTFSMIVALAAALIFPCLAFMVVFGGQDVASRWIESYQPVVYLVPDATEAQVKDLRAELESWPSVSEVVLRSPAQAKRSLETRLGRDSIESLGISDSMLPTSMILVPSQGLSGHIDLVSKTAGLEARMEVDRVQVPGVTGVRVLSMISGGLIFSSLLALLSLLAFCLLLSGYLKRLMESEKEMADMMSIFGASSASLRRPTLVRGVGVGGWAGGVAATVLVVVLVVAQSIAQTLLGISTTMVYVWPFVLAPVIFGAGLGFLIGLAHSRPSMRPSGLAPRLLEAYHV